jgi:hypothetical protein
MVQKYIQPQREIPVIAKVDVLVVGGGPAGVSAAVGAARVGAVTMIVECLGSFGGMWTNGLVITLAGFNSWLKPYRRCVSGVPGEWLGRAAVMGGAEDNRGWALNSDPEVMKLVADELLLDAGVSCLLHTWVAEPIMEGKQVKGVVVENVDGRGAIFSGAVVDCTGNGDVFARAGAEHHLSDQLQPMTLPMYIGNVVPVGEISYEEEVLIPIGPEPGLLRDPELTAYASRRRDFVVDREKLAEARANGYIPTFGGPWFGGMEPNTAWVNTTRVYGSAINADELTRAEMEARKDAHTIFNYYRDELEGFEKAHLLQTSSTIGIRETRRLRGVFTLTGEDIRSQTHFEDPVALGAWPIDVHPSQGQSGVHAMYVPLPYEIPYRTLLPQDIEQLVVGGRCISLDREALGSARVGATCGATGQAAGVAAALAVKGQSRIRDVAYVKLKSELEKQDVLLA